MHLNYKIEDVCVVILIHPIGVMTYSAPVNKHQKQQEIIALHLQAKSNFAALTISRIHWVQGGRRGIQSKSNLLVKTLI